MTQSYRADCRAIARLRQARLRLGCLRAGFALWRKLPAPDRTRDPPDFAFPADFLVFAGAFPAERTVLEVLRLLLPPFLPAPFAAVATFLAVLGTAFAAPLPCLPAVPRAILAVPADFLVAPVPARFAVGFRLVVPARLADPVPRDCPVGRLAARLVAAGFRFLGPLVPP